MIRYPFAKHHTFTIQTGRVCFSSGKRVEMAAHIHNDRGVLIAVIAVEGDGSNAIRAARSWLDLTFALDVQRAEQERLADEARAARLEAARLDDKRRQEAARQRRELENDREIAAQMRANMVSASRVGRRYDPRPVTDRLRGY